MNAFEVCESGGKTIASVDLAGNCTVDWDAVKGLAAAPLILSDEAMSLGEVSARSICRLLVRARSTAIDAMREPTEAMLKAGNAVMRENCWGECGEWAHEIWPAMIDAASRE